MGAQSTTDGITNGNGDVRARADEVVKDVKDLGRDLKGLAGAASEAAQEQARAAGAKLSEASRHARERLSDASRTARERAAHGAERAVEEVRAHPGAAIGLALGAGVLLGVLIARRR